MKILSLHCDYIKFQPLKKAIKSIPDLDEKEKKEIEVKNPLGIFVAVEKQDELDLRKAIDNLVLNVKDLMSKTKAEKIVLYPYAHLSNNLSNPEYAQDVLKGVEALLIKQKIPVFRAPFGYYKTFELKCKGHPLSELSREIKIECDMVEQDKSNQDKSKPLNLNKDETYDPKQLLKQISKSKLDTSKLKDNDHRIIGKNLDLFSFSETAPGMVFFHNKGWIIWNELIKYWRELHQKAGYEEIRTPQILDKKLWQISGHWEKYKENIFLTSYDNREFAVKPMNCPGGMLVYKNTPKSYKDFPLKVAELGCVHRQELSGVLGGMFRVIQFTQDDAHIFCTEEQIEKEVIGIMQLVDEIYKKFNLKYRVELSTRPEKRIGDDKIWDKTEKILEDVLKRQKIKYKLNKGDGAFYGPKIDFHLKDSLNREWQTATIQLDMAMPERFDLTYKDKNNKDKRPIMLHRTILGGIERFYAILLEHTNGNLPTWLAPIQVRVLSFTDRNEKAAKQLADKLKKEYNIRVDTDTSSTTMSDKVRTAEMQKIPYIITIGDKEEEKQTIAVRKRDEKKLKFDVKFDDFVEGLKSEIDNRG